MRRSYSQIGQIATGMRIEERPNAVRIAIHVQPRASRTEIAGLHGEALKIRLSAPPVDDAANTALMTFLAERLALPRHAVTIVSGAKSRAKIVEITGLSVAELRRKLNLTE
jgi:uncharacterized protein (TIGR00251 family)